MLQWWPSAYANGSIVSRAVLAVYSWQTRAQRRSSVALCYWLFNVILQEKRVGIENFYSHALRVSHSTQDFVF